MSGKIGTPWAKSGFITPSDHAQHIWAFTTDTGWINPGAKVPWTSIEQDLDGCCDVSTDLFTAPVDGIYLFWGSYYINNNNNTTYLYVYINGSSTNYCAAGDNVFGENGSDSNDDSTANPSITLKLNAGDTMYWHLDGEIYTGHSMAGGCRIGQI